MEYRENGSRYNRYYLWDNAKNQEYDYKNKGLIQYIMSSKIVNSENHILRTILRKICHLYQNAYIQAIFLKCASCSPTLEHRYLKTYLLLIIHKWASQVAQW